MTAPDPWPCPWCGHNAPTQSMRDQHLRECLYRPEETA